jgi:hypothetical protein
MIDVMTKVCEKCKHNIVGVGYKMIGDKIVRWCEQCKPDNAVSGRPKRAKPADTS